MLTQSQARQILKELREDIKGTSYDCVDKRHLGRLFNALKIRLSDGTIYASPKKLNAIADLEQKWQRDRINAAAGADTIFEILSALELMYIPELPAALPPQEMKYFAPIGQQPMLSEKAVEDIVKRTLAAANV
jgi:hypothetical protein